jgi:hypothetical protein
MTLEECIQWKKEIRNRTQILRTIETTSPEDNLFEIEYLRCRDRGIEMDGYKFREYVKMLRQKNGRS